MGGWSLQAFRKQEGFGAAGSVGVGGGKVGGEVSPLFQEIARKIFKDPKYEGILQKARYLAENPTTKEALMAGEQWVETEVDDQKVRIAFDLTSGEYKIEALGEVKKSTEIFVSKETGQYVVLRDLSLDEKRLLQNLKYKVGYKKDGTPVKLAVAPLQITEDEMNTLFAGGMVKGKIIQGQKVDIVFDKDDPRMVNLIINNQMAASFSKDGLALDLMTADPAKRRKLENISGLEYVKDLKKLKEAVDKGDFESEEVKIVARRLGVTAQALASLDYEMALRYSPFIRTAADGTYTLALENTGGDIPDAVKQMANEKYGFDLKWDRNYEEQYNITETALAWTGRQLFEEKHQEEGGFNPINILFGAPGERIFEEGWTDFKGTIPVVSGVLDIGKALLGQRVSFQAVRQVVRPITGGGPTYIEQYQQYLALKNGLKNTYVALPSGKRVSLWKRLHDKEVREGKEGMSLAEVAAFFNPQFHQNVARTTSALRGAVDIGVNIVGLAAPGAAGNVGRIPILGKVVNLTVGLGEKWGGEVVAKLAGRALVGRLALPAGRAVAESVQFLPIAAMGVGLEAGPEIIGSYFTGFSAVMSDMRERTGVKMYDAGSIREWLKPGFDILHPNRQYSEAEYQYLIERANKSLIVPAKKEEEIASLSLIQDYLAGKNLNSGEKAKAKETLEWLEKYKRAIDASEVGQFAIAAKRSLPIQAGMTGLMWVAAPTFFSGAMHIASKPLGAVWRWTREIKKPKEIAPGVHLIDELNYVLELSPEELAKAGVDDALAVKQVWIDALIKGGADGKPRLVLTPETVIDGIKLEGRKVRVITGGTLSRRSVEVVLGTGKGQARMIRVADLAEGEMKELVEAIIGGRVKNLGFKTYKGEMETVLGEARRMFKKLVIAKPQVALKEGKSAVLTEEEGGLPSGAEPVEDLQMPPGLKLQQKFVQAARKLGGPVEAPKPGVLAGLSHLVNKAGQAIGGFTTGLQSVVVKGKGGVVDFVVVRPAKWLGGTAKAVGNGATGLLTHLPAVGRVAETAQAKGWLAALKDIPGDVFGGLSKWLGRKGKPVKPKIEMAPIDEAAVKKQATEYLIETGDVLTRDILDNPDYAEKMQRALASADEMVKRAEQAGYFLDRERALKRAIYEEFYSAPRKVGEGTQMFTEEEVLRMRLANYNRKLLGLSAEEAERGVAFGKGWHYSYINGGVEKATKGLDRSFRGRIYIDTHPEYGVAIFEMLKTELSSHRSKPQVTMKIIGDLLTGRDIFTGLVNESSFTRPDKILIYLTAKDQKAVLQALEGVYKKSVKLPKKLKKSNLALHGDEVFKDDLPELVGQLRDSRGQVMKGVGFAQSAYSSELSFGENVAELFALMDTAGIDITNPSLVKEHFAEFALAEGFRDPQYPFLRVGVKDFKRVNNEWLAPIESFTHDPLMDGRVIFKDMFSRCCEVQAKPGVITQVKETTGRFFEGIGKGLGKLLGLRPAEPAAPMIKGKKIQVGSVVDGHYIPKGTEIGIKNPDGSLNIFAVVTYGKKIPLPEIPEGGSLYIGLPLSSFEVPAEKLLLSKTIQAPTLADTIANSWPSRGIKGIWQLGVQTKEAFADLTSKISQYLPFFPDKQVKAVFKELEPDQAEFFQEVMRNVADLGVKAPNRKTARGQLKWIIKKNLEKELGESFTSLSVHQKNALTEAVYRNFGFEQVSLSLVYRPSKVIARPPAAEPRPLGIETKYKALEVEAIQGRSGEDVGGRRVYENGVVATVTVDGHGGKEAAYKARGIFFERFKGNNLDEAMQAVIKETENIPSGATFAVTVVDPQTGVAQIRIVGNQRILIYSTKTGKLVGNYTHPFADVSDLVAYAEKYPNTPEGRRIRGLIENGVIFRDEAGSWRAGEGLATINTLGDQGVAPGVVTHKPVAYTHQLNDGDIIIQVSDGPASNLKMKQGYLGLPGYKDLVPLRGVTSLENLISKEIKGLKKQYKDPYQLAQALKSRLERWTHPDPGRFKYYDEVSQQWKVFTDDIVVGMGVFEAPTRPKSGGFFQQLLSGEQGFALPAGEKVGGFLGRVIEKATEGLRGVFMGISFFGKFVLPQQYQSQEKEKKISLSEDVLTIDSSGRQFLVNPFSKKTFSLFGINLPFNLDNIPPFSSTGLFEKQKKEAIIQKFNEEAKTAVGKMLDVYEKDKELIKMEEALEMDVALGEPEFFFGPGGNLIKNYNKAIEFFPANHPFAQESGFGAFHYNDILVSWAKSLEDKIGKENVDVMIALIYSEGAGGAWMFRDGDVAKNYNANGSIDYGMFGINENNKCGDNFCVGGDKRLDTGVPFYFVQYDPRINALAGLLVYLQKVSFVRYGMKNGIEVKNKNGKVLYSYSPEDFQKNCAEHIHACAYSLYNRGFDEPFYFVENPSDFLSALTTKPWEIPYQRRKFHLDLFGTVIPVEPASSSEEPLPSSPPLPSPSPFPLPFPFPSPLPSPPPPLLPEPTEETGFTHELCIRSGAGKAAVNKKCEGKPVYVEHEGRCYGEMPHGDYIEVNPVLCNQSSGENEQSFKGRGKDELSRIFAKMVAVKRPFNQQGRNFFPRKLIGEVWAEEDKQIKKQTLSGQEVFLVKPEFWQVVTGREVKPTGYKIGNKYVVATGIDGRVSFRTDLGEYKVKVRPISNLEIKAPEKYIFSTRDDGVIRVGIARKRNWGGKDS